MSSRRIRLAAALFAGQLLLATAVAAAELESAQIDVDFRQDAVHVTASYRLSGEDDVRFLLRRLAGQELRLVTGPGELQGSAALSYFDARPAAGAVAVSYELRGDRQRVPLFVPDAAASGPVEIRLRGVRGDLALRDGFPRLEASGDGALLARPAHLPSFVRLPPPRGRLSVHRAAEATVVLLVVVATALWIRRLRQGKRRQGERSAVESATDAY